jgi:hypothetical protein
MAAEDALDDRMHDMPGEALQELLLGAGLPRDTEAVLTRAVGVCGAQADEQRLHDPAKDDLLRGHVDDLEAAVSNLET